MKCAFNSIIDFPREERAVELMMMKRRKESEQLANLENEIERQSQSYARTAFHVQCVCKSMPAASPAPPETQVLVPGPRDLSAYSAVPLSLTLPGPGK